VVHIEETGILAGDAELIDVRPGRRVYLIAGYYEIFKIRFDGDVVLVTMYSEARKNDAVSVDAATIAYFKIHGGFSGTLARLADFLFPKKVDERIERFVRAAESIAVAVNKDPAKAYGKLKSAGEVSAEKLEEFGRTFLP
jgi:hypothetical protein